MGFRQQSKIEKIVGWGKKCRGRIFIVGNDSTKNARRIIKLEVDPTITTRERTEVLATGVRFPGAITVEFQSLPIKMFTGTIMFIKRGTLGPQLRSCQEEHETDLGLFRFRLIS